MLVRFFAGAADAAGRTQTEVEPPPTVGDLVATLSRDDERLTAVLEVSTFLVSGRRADADAPLLPTDVVDVLPPFAGG